MQAVVYEEYGDASVLKLKQDYPVPKISNDEILIQVKAAGVNPVDWKIRKHLIPAWPQKLPIIPGWDVAGVVKDVGSACKTFKVGDEVYSYARPAFDMDGGKNELIGDNGTAAQYIAVKEWKVSLKPKSISLSEASGIPLAALTAYQGLFDHGKVKAGDTVLILNSSGGVGSFGVQLAKAKGATVIGTCSARNLEFVKSLGADHVIDYTKGSVADQVAALGKTIDVVYDCVGGDSVKEGIKAVKADGRVISICEWGIAKLCEEANKATGIAFLVKPSNEQLTEIAGLVDSGKVKVAKVEELPLKDAAAAHTKSETGRVTGKLVLIV